MILSCPFCQTRYLIQAAAFAAGPRTVRCAKCKHQWKAEPPANVEVAGVPVVELVALPRGEKDAHAQANEASSANLPAVRSRIPPAILNYMLEIALSFILGIILLWLILDHQHIAKRWTFMEPIYNAIGLYVFYPGDGLELDNIRSELKFDSGINKLFVSGTIKNTTKKNQKVPNMIVEALGSDGAILQSWQIDAPVATLSPTTDTQFESSINAPKGNVVNINLKFVEIKDDD
jgi:predicted Zn finger-like uncharacterized protein